MRSDPPPDNHPRVDVDDEAHIGDTGPRRHVRQIGDPQLVRGRGSEVPAHQVRVPRHARVGLGGADPLGAPNPLDPSGAHQPRDLVAADVMAPASGGLPDLPGAVNPVVVLPQLTHHRAHHLIALGTGRRLTILELVVAARGHLQHGADELDPQTPTRDDVVAVGVDERGYFLCWRSSSAPRP